MKDLVRLRRIYSSLHDGMAKREDYFELSIAEPAGGAEGDVKNPFEGKEEKPKPAGKGVKRDEAESK